MSILIFTNKFVLCLLLDVLLLFNTFCFLDSDRWLSDGLNANFWTEQIWPKILSILETLLFRLNSQKILERIKPSKDDWNRKGETTSDPIFQVIVYSCTIVILIRSNNLFQKHRISCEIFTFFKRIKNHKWNFYEPVSVLKFA